MIHNCSKSNMPMKKANKANLVSFPNVHVVIRKEQSTQFRSNESSISCYVCADCGYIELYADKPEKLK